MYKKNLSEKINLRLTPSQLSFIVDLATVRQCSCSDVIRGIVDYYIIKWEDNSNGNNTTYFDSKL